MEIVKPHDTKFESTVNVMGHEKKKNHLNGDTRLA